MIVDNDYWFIAMADCGEWWHLLFNGHELMRSMMVNDAYTTDAGLLMVNNGW